MISFEDVELYLPKYLSVESKTNLFQELKTFPQNIDKRLFTNNFANSEIIYQGDGLSDLLVVNLPSNQINVAKCIILSNTCDIDPNNNRYFPSRIAYCPIISLKKYKSVLIEEGVYAENKIEDHISAIKKQYITQIFFLPASGCLEESIVFFDTILNCDNNAVERSTITARRLFSLSDFGLYLFLFKLSLHFTRIQEGIERGYM